MFESQCADIDARRRRQRSSARRSHHYAEIRVVCQWHEYFNTFGGNPVSCAVGLAVLDVIRDEELQEHALEVGAYLKGKLTELKSGHSLVGDVRGAGLFIGIELVRDRQTLEPADREAAALIEQMKERGILLSTDGPFHNVIKIKPPLVFSRRDADESSHKWRKQPVSSERKELFE